MSIIRVMDENLANKIAAGEVVERVVSIVKELVENSIDAGSDFIKIELIEAGLREIKVTDNGVGMEHEDAKLAFSRHATSKLKSLDLSGFSTIEIYSDDYMEYEFQLDLFNLPTNYKGNIIITATSPQNPKYELSIYIVLLNITNSIVISIIGFNSFTVRGLVLRINDIIDSHVIINFFKRVA